MKNAFLSLLILLTFARLKAQEQKTDSVRQFKNTFYVELLGNGGLYSVNYDRIVYRSKPFRLFPFLNHKGQFKVSGRLGYSHVPPPLAYNHIFTFPFEIGLMYGRRSHLELSGGWSPVMRLRKGQINQIYDTYSYWLVRLSYRYQKPTGGFFLRFGAGISLSTPKYFDGIPGNPWVIGIGLGYTLKN